jgi:hypothetical protein
MSREKLPERVGYKNPPEHSRFKKGQSGNPSGRRKSDAKPPPQDVREIVLSQPVPVAIDGKRVKVTARHALYQKLLAMAFEGNLRAIGLLLKAEGLNDNAAASRGELGLTSEEEEALIARFLARIKRSGGSSDV